MDLEPCIHSFIIKIWLEESARESGRAVWRGRITHVASDERKFIKSMDEIVAFIRSYLGETQRKSRWQRQLAEWLKRWRVII